MGSRFAIVRLAAGALGGGPAWWRWVSLLAAGFALGVVAYLYQHHHGLAATTLTDQVPWGAYIANFTYLVGMATAPVMVVVPGHVYGQKTLRPLVFAAECVALSATLMALLFVVVDIEKPERAWHLIPGVGVFNFPASMLAWDVVVLNGYLALVLAVLGYSVVSRVRGTGPRPSVLTPLVLVSAGWAVVMHTVTAFLYAGFAGRPFWNNAVLAPRFLVSAFATGVATLLLVGRAIERATEAPVEESARRLLERILVVALGSDLFLLACQVFVELYSQAAEAVPMRYLFFGLRGHRLLVPWAWLGVVSELAAFVFFLRTTRAPPKPGRLDVADLACAAALVGIWFGKGMSLVIPGFVPSQLGEMVEYRPSLVETLVSVGIWCFGLLLLSVLVRLEHVAAREAAPARSP